MDGKVCSQVEHTKGKEEVEVSCVLPPMSSSAPPPSWTQTFLETSTPLSGEGFHHEGAASAVEVMNGRMPGLKHVVPYLSYQARQSRDLVLPLDPTIRSNMCEPTNWFTCRRELRYTFTYVAPAHAVKPSSQGQCGGWCVVGRTTWSSLRSH